jgi:probable phosphoglycerate mutase
MSETMESPSFTSPPVARITLVRHASTEWSRSGRHTSFTDLPLDELGRRQAEALGGRLGRFDVRAVYSSPRRRALDTCLLAGFTEPVVLADLAEWDYGDYEGLTTAEIRAERPGWSIFEDGCPGGEDAKQVARRCERALAAIPLDPSGEGTALVFAHSHLLRVFAVTYLGLEPVHGRLVALDTGSVSVLGFDRQGRVLRLWNS